MRIFLILSSSLLVGGGIKMLNPDCPIIPVLMIILGDFLLYILGCYMGGKRK